jgi:predicted solute-binding protein
VAAGDADIGILPVIEMERLGLKFVPGLGIACRGPVRTILLVSRVPFEEIKILAVDSGSRSSVQLARVILSRRYGAEPALLPMRPDLVGMLGAADAALIIGDAALAIDLEDLDLPFLDLGEEWVSMTGLPMVFAVWAGNQEKLTPRLAELLEGSCQYGLGDLDRIIVEESERRGFPEHVVQQYLTRHIVFQLGEEEHAGMRNYLESVRALNAAPVLVPSEMQRSAHSSR